MPRTLKRYDLAKIHPNRSTSRIWRGTTILISDLNGAIENEKQGLFVCETRVLSRWRHLINGRPLHSIVHSPVRPHASLGYYVIAPPGVHGLADKGSGHIENESQLTLEMKLARFVGEGLHEDIRLTNFTQSRTDPFQFEIEVDADFSDIGERGGSRTQQGEIEKSWTVCGSSGELISRYRASHRYSNQGNDGEASIDRIAILTARSKGVVPSYARDRISFRFQLEAHQTIRIELDLAAVIDGQALVLGKYTESFASKTVSDEKRERYLSTSASVNTTSRTLSDVVEDAVERAKDDLASLRIDELDSDDHSWVPAAGVPLYLALFGRDTLSVGWQSALFSTDILRGVLKRLARCQGTDLNDWRDEQPGRILHESHRGPLATLRYNPRERYYGSITATSCFVISLSEYWHWSGDRETVGALLDSAKKALGWLDTYARLENGFYGYQTRSCQGVEHQSWKDSGDSMVFEDGAQAGSPIACCEEQGYVYAAKLRMAEMLLWFGELHASGTLLAEANDLRRRFNQAFWMNDLGYFAMGIDSHGRIIRSVASNPLHTMAAGVVNLRYARKTASRLLQPDLFSGWGIRTLSSEHPAYDPYSYHRGSVWPTEAGAAALGFKLYGLEEDVHRICLSQFEALQLFEHYRFPEVLSGHPRDEFHPFPALYPDTCWPQAWSASMVASLIQAMVGIYPYAPLQVLLVDPSLPEWLPDLTIENLRVGEAIVSLRFHRTSDGTTTYRVMRKEGKLHIIRQPRVHGRFGLE